MICQKSEILAQGWGPLSVKYSETTDTDDQSKGSVPWIPPKLLMLRAQCPSNVRLVVFPPVPNQETFLSKRSLVSKTSQFHYP